MIHEVKYIKLLIIYHKYETGKTEINFKSREKKEETHDRQFQDIFIDFIFIQLRFPFLRIYM